MKKRILYGFGDSLVEGHCIGIGMLDSLAEKYGLVYRKYARNGARVLPDNDFNRKDSCQVPDIASQIRMACGDMPDLIFFDGLTNDAYAYVAEEYLGELTDHYRGNYDRMTFYGAFEQICWLLREKYPDSRIFYVCPHRMPARDMKVQEMLQKAAREICRKWSIPYVDIFRKGQINTCVDAMRVRYSYDEACCLTGGNGTHLNAEGYERWYLPMIEAKAFPCLQNKEASDGEKDDEQL